MDYWRGQMDLRLDADWKCEICGENIGLEWGLIHSECRCNSCHSIYWMRDFTKPDKPVVSKPISGVLPKYKEALRQAINTHKAKFDDLTDEDIEKFMPKAEAINVK